MMDLDTEWLAYGLGLDAQLIAALTIEGKHAEIEAHKAACGYDERLATWRAAR